MPWVQGVRNGPTAGSDNQQHSPRRIINGTWGVKVKTKKGSRLTLATTLSTNGRMQYRNAEIDAIALSATERCHHKMISNLQLFGIKTAQLKWSASRADPWIQDSTSYGRSRQATCRDLRQDFTSCKRSRQPTCRVRRQDTTYSGNRRAEMVVAIASWPK